MITTKPIASYVNGNCRVTIYGDGTKVREYEGSPRPVFPESMDVKITNYCDAGCAFCHEMSTREGKHGDLLRANSILSTMPRGSEIAIGGGNPLSHPDLMAFLVALHVYEIVANMTVNHFHLRRYRDAIAEIRRKGLIYGLGISYLPPLIDTLGDFLDENTVLHLIIGVHPISELDKLLQRYPRLKVLLLGYKQFGRGESFYQKMSKTVEANIYGWTTQLYRYLRRPGLTISFDNLAIRQLDVRRFFSPEAWSRFYMGDDGQFTMYMDFVKGEYAVSSTSPIRYQLTNDLRGMFAHVRSQV